MAYMQKMKMQGILSISHMQGREKHDTGIQRNEASLSFKMIREVFMERIAFNFVFLKKWQDSKWQQTGAWILGGRNSRNTGERILKSTKSQVWLEVNVHRE